MNGELVRLVETIRRDKSIDGEIIFQGIESALVSAAKKHFGAAEDVSITIDRASGQMEVIMGGQRIDPTGFGRIAAQTAKQVIIQKIREAERASLMENYADQIGAIISGQVTRVEHGNAVVSLSRGEGFLPKSEQIPGETLHVGDRLRALIIEVREAGASVKIVLSRTHPDLIARLFELEVPEVAEQTIVIEAIAREPGRRTKVAVSSIDSRVDPVGACVGIRGSRIKNIVAEVANEKVDIARYNESPQIFIADALKPAQVKEVLLNRDINRATVLAADDQLSLAIGKKGQNVRLAARITGWNIDIMTPAEYEQQRAAAYEQLVSLEAVGAELANELVAAGYISLADVAEVGAETLSRLLRVEPEQVQRIIVQTAALVATLEIRAAAEAKLAAETAAAEAKLAAETPAEVADSAETIADAETAPDAPATTELPEADAAAEEPEETPAEVADSAETIADAETPPDAPTATETPQAEADATGEQAVQTTPDDDKGADV
ncbi:MAG: transcription termination factor NusA [Planctomycetota bacterium]|nr:transcription termination factor NusA [Planctomycetota bacterium]